jgi:hypothetical protein
LDDPGFDDIGLVSLPVLSQKTSKIGDKRSPMKCFLTMQSNSAPQHENENERQDCRRDDPDVAPAYAFRSQLNRPFQSHQW